MNDNARFKEGEEVIALSNPKNDKCQPRVKGTKYIVKAVKYCSKCGTQTINLGARIPDNFVNYNLCGRNNMVNNQRLRWTTSNHFARPNDLKVLDIKLAENNQFEEAIVIRDLLKN